MAEYLNGAEAFNTAMEGCPDPTAGSAILLSSTGTEQTICHVLKNRHGVPINLTQYDPAVVTNHEFFLFKPPGTPDSMGLFQNALCPHGKPKVGELVFADAPNGRVCVKVPLSVSSRPGIYQTDIVIIDALGRPMIKDSLLLSMERSLLGSYLGNSQTIGPITLGEVRTQLRDYASLNTAWDNAEFSDAEIVHSLLQPIKAFNEMPPRGAAFTAENFPWHNQWLEAAIANLMKLGANWYLRNSQKISYGDNKTSDDKDKVRDYISIAESKWNSFLQFSERQKVTANWSNGYSNLGGTIRGY